MKDLELRVVIPGRGGQNPPPLIKCHVRSVSLPTPTSARGGSQFYDDSPLSPDEQRLWSEYIRDESFKLAASASSPCLVSPAEGISPCPSLSNSPTLSFYSPHSNSPTSTLYSCSPHSPYPPSSYRSPISQASQVYSLYSPFASSPLAASTHSSYFLDRVGTYELEAEPVPLTSGNYLNNKPLPPEPGAKGWKKLKKNIKPKEEAGGRREKAFSFHFGKAHFIFGPEKEELAELRRKGKDKKARKDEKRGAEKEVW